MIAPALALCGWVTAAVAVALGLWAWRTRAMRMEAVARACHELRGPITASRLGLQLEARGSELSAARLRAIDLELGRAALALDDLLGVRRGHVQSAAARPFELGPLLTDAVEASRPGAAERGVELELNGAAGAGSIPGDPLRIAQAIRNLLANAIEHGGGRVEVRCRLDAGGARIEVVDGGPGLPAPVAELTRRARGGRGVRGRGLAIAATIAADHGGRLASAPSERGARLILELPAALGGGEGRSSNRP